MTTTTRLIGIGHPDRGDDAAGLELARGLGVLPAGLVVYAIEGADWPSCPGAERKGTRMQADALKAWITEHRVCWELSPRFEVYEHQKKQVGFDLTLFARHPESWKDEPGCEICLEHYETLKEIALQALPPTQASRCEFAPFDASFHLRPEANWEPEVQLDVAILHRDSTFAEVDAEEREVTAEIEEGLKRMGVKAKVWPDAEPVNGGR